MRSGFVPERCFCVVVVALTKTACTATLHVSSSQWVVPGGLQAAPSLGHAVMVGRNATTAIPLKTDEAGAEAGVLAPTRLRVEYRRTPLLGLDVPAPRFSWALSSTSRGLTQAAYELQIGDGSSSWSSGKVSSNRSQNVLYSGPPLSVDTDFTFNVTVWPTGGVGCSTQSSSFSTGISNADWGAARWLGLNSTGNRGFQVRKEVYFLSQGVRRVVAYVIGLGYYKLDVSGSRVSTHELGPFTSFFKRVLYDTYDLTATAQTAAALNRPLVLAATVAPGWFTLLGAGAPRFRCKLSITYIDGSTSAVVSGDNSRGSWRVAPSPLLKAHIYDGEVWDARLEQPRWNAGTGFTEAPGVWSAPSLMPAPAGDEIQYSSHAALPPIRATQDFAPCDMWQLKDEPGVYIFDMCQNMAGITTLRLREGIYSSMNITQTFSESTLAAKPAGINRGMQQYAKETNVYITRGDGKAAVYRTGYVYAGFRYIEVRGLPYTPDESTLEAHFVHTDLEPVGAISFSDPLLVSIQRAARASAMSNFMHVPTDCSQRERRGWLGDAQLAASALTHMFDTGSAYTSFVQQIRDTQNRVTGEVQDCVPWYGHGFEPADPAWGAAFTLLPELIGAHYDDDQIFVRQYAGISAHLESLIRMASGALLPGGPNDPHPGKHDLDGQLLSYGPYGDWCPARGCVECADPRKDPTAYNSALVASFYYISELRIVTRYAATLGKSADAVRYGDIAANASKDFMRQFYDITNNTFRETNRACTQYLSPQTSISLGHELGLLPRADTAKTTQ
jgi:alpha-L-rhamnosidase